MLYIFLNKVLNAIFEDGIAFTTPFMFRKSLSGVHFGEFLNLNVL